MLDIKPVHTSLSTNIYYVYLMNGRSPDETDSKTSVIIGITTVLVLHFQSQYSCGLNVKIVPQYFVQ